MSAVLSVHARSQIAARSITTESEVLSAVNRHESAIRTAQVPEVRVVVKTLRVPVFLPDGSNGDCVIACIDTSTAKVKTVMLQRSTQVERKSREVPYLK